MVNTEYCDGCRWLSPTEEEQQNNMPVRVIHICTKHWIEKPRLFHGSHHPKILKPNWCKGYEL